MDGTSATWAHAHIIDCARYLVIKINTVLRYVGKGLLDVAFLLTKSKQGRIKTMEDLEEREKGLAAMLKENPDSDLERDADILKQMGDVYHEKGQRGKMLSDFVKSSALYNAAIVRTKKGELSQELERCLVANETAFCNVLDLEVSDQDLPSSQRPKCKEFLRDIRLKTQQTSEKIMKTFNDNFKLDDPDPQRMRFEKRISSDVQRLFEDMNEELKEFIRYLLEISKKLLGQPPQEYATIALGSLARCESTPFSDFEWAILVHDDSKDKDYFRRLVYMVHMFVVNLAESKLRGIGIKSLNDFDAPGGDWFRDTVTPTGFYFDSCAPWACHIPTGRPERPTKEGIEFIQTPEKLASFSKLAFANKEGYHIGRILSTVSLIEGSGKAGELVDHYKEALSKILKQDKVVEAKRKEIIDLISDFEGKLIHRRHTHDFVLNIKQDLYRLPSLVINVFQTIHDVQGDNTWDSVDKLFSKKVLCQEGSNNMKLAISLVSLLRLVMYAMQGRQSERISIPQSRQFKSLVLRFHLTVAPMMEMFKQAGKYESFVFHEKVFFEKDKFIIGMVNLGFCEYASAVKNFLDAIDKDTSNIYRKCDCYTFAVVAQIYCGGHQALEDLISKATESLLSEYLTRNDEREDRFVIMALASVGLRSGDKKIIKIHSDALKAFNLKYGETDHIQMASTLDSIGWSCAESGDLGSAIEFKSKALAMYKRIYDGKDHRHVAFSLYSLGHSYSIYGDQNTAIIYESEALEMYRRLYGDNARADVAETLVMLGYSHGKAGHLKTSSKYKSDTLAMFKLIHGVNDHREVARAMHNIGCTYGELGDHRLAISLVLDALAMYKRIYGESDRSEVALSLTALGYSYSESGDHKTAIKNASDAVTMYSRMYGENDHRERPIALRVLGSSCSKNGDHELSIKFISDAVAMYRRMHDEKDHSDMARALRDLGCSYGRSGDHTSAIKYVNDALNMYKRIYDENDHYQVARTLTSLGSSYGDIKNYTLAIQYGEEALTMYERVYDGDDHPDVARTLDNLSRSYCKTGHHEKAAKYRSDAEEMYKRMADRPSVFDHGEGRLGETRM